MGNLDYRHERALEWVEKGMGYLEQGLPCPPSTWPGGSDRLPDTDETLLRSVKLKEIINMTRLSQEGAHGSETGDEMSTQVTLNIDQYCFDVEPKSQEEERRYVPVKYSPTQRGYRKCLCCYVQV